MNLSSTIINNLSSSVPNGTFLVIGAYDGMQNEIFAPLATEHGWEGVMVEPNPASFAKLQANYADYANVLLENSAIADKDDTMTMFIPVVEDDSMKWLPQVATLDAEHLKLSEIAFKNQSPQSSGLQTNTIEVNALTFNSLLKKHNLQSIDALKIDAEGYDLTILKQIQFDRISPMLVTYEYYGLPYADVMSSIKLMQSAGYMTYWESTDIFAVRNDKRDVLLPKTISWKHSLWYLYLRRFPLVTWLKNKWRQLR